VRLVLLGTGSAIATKALDALSREHDVAAVVMPPWRGWQLRLMTRRFRSICRRRGIPIIPLDADAIARCNADLLCVATFPQLLRDEVLSAASQGAINLHPSLLPKHRGPDPLFWTYFHGERTAGVTVHWIEGGVDSGDVIEQVELEVACGESSVHLHRRLADAGAAAMLRAVNGIEAGTAPRIAQDQSIATQEPNPWTKGWTFEWSTWTAERLWHFLAGLSSQSNDLLRGPRHGPPLRFSEERHERAPGTIEVGKRIRVYVTDGWVDVRRDSPAWRTLRLLNRLL